MFCGKLINNELRLAVVESSLFGATAHEKKLVEDTLQEGRSKVLNIIRNFHI